MRIYVFGGLFAYSLIQQASIEHPPSGGYEGLPTFHMTCCFLLVSLVVGWGIPCTEIGNVLQGWKDLPGEVTFALKAK